jgi:RNA polymerase-binding transcription factor DksA
MDKRTARKLLREERARLEALLETSDLDSVDDVTTTGSVAELASIDQHPADMGTETFERQKDVSIRGSIQSALEDVGRAERRVDEGTYGTCEACGRPIGDARLKVRPAARFCVDDQAAAEREARAAAG